MWFTNESEKAFAAKGSFPSFPDFPVLNPECAKPGTCEVTLRREGTAGLGTLSPAWIIDELCGVEMVCVCAGR